MTKNRNNRGRGFRPGIKLLCFLLLLTLVFQSAIPAFTALAAEPANTTTLTTVCRGEDGKSYRVTASYGADAVIPADAVLTVVSLSATDGDNESYVSQAEQALRCSIDRETEIQLFDISIVSADDPSVEYQPAERASVEMKVRVASAPETEIGVIHFGEETEQVDSSVEGRNVSFEAAGFSVYALVSISARDEIVHDVSGFDDEPVYLSAANNNSTYYFKGTIAQDGSKTLIAKTAANDTTGAAAYSFEKVEGTEDRFYMYLTGENDNVKYLKFTRDTNVDFVDLKSDATVITVVPCGSSYPNQFFLTYTDNGITHYLNAKGNFNGKGFAGSTDGDSAGSRISAYYVLPTDNDVLGLNGKTYGIAWLNNRNTAIAMTAQAKSSTALKADSMPVRANPLDQSEDVMIKVDGNVALYSFHVVGRNQYYISTDVGGATKYLNAQGGALTLVDQPTEYSVFVPTLGTGANAGRIKFVGKTSGQAISLPGGNASNGFTAKNANTTNEYFYFADPRDLADDDIVSYTAVKVSVSDTARVRNGSQVIVYTRIWNDTSKEYEFYAINHDGSLKRIFDEGDTIRWAGTQVNTLLWEFTEYYYWLTRIPNYYYELQNTYSGKYIAPQYHSGQVLSNRKIGINLNGRRYNEYYTTILAWDDYRYDYAGLKADGFNLSAVPMTKAQDFYFAIMDTPVPEEFSTVETVDNNDYGIKMHLTDYNNALVGNKDRDKLQTDVLGSDTTKFTGGSKPLLDLVSTDLKENGYPTATHTGRSLIELFPTDAEEVNHLFLKSTYEETGYFEYDCTKNFATKLNNGDFRLYKQLGTVEVSTNSQGHGFFMPYNDITPNRISQYTNQTNVVNEALATDDPRLGETLYSIPSNEADYYFGLEMEASFIQSESGLDAWGHDIIFEFAGDDDTWLFVDGELVLDLGGIHSAVTGSINFSTGVVKVPDANGNMYTTTLHDIFEQNFRGRNPNASEEDVQDYLDGIFVYDGGKYVFKDYSTHTMKMLYMERGRGASNLHMRFNLTTAVPGQLLISKSVSGTDKQDYVSAKFPYQIYYYDDNYAAFRTVSRTTVVNGDSTRYDYTGAKSVYYRGSVIPVEYAPSYTAGSGDTYENVFFLKPGEEAEVQFPGDGIRYYVKECGVDHNIYDVVSVNGTPVEGVLRTNDSYDYSSPEDVIEERKVVKFDNHVNQAALRILSITKNLFDVNNTQLHYADDPTGFRFRVYIGEGNDLDGLSYYRFEKYYIKDPSGNYCKYDHQTQKFISIGKNDFNDLTEDDLESCTFITSPSGAIDKIPADFTVEIRNLLVDTKFMVLEKSSDIPKGYDLIGYERLAGSYLAEGDTANAGIVRDNSNPHVIVKNHRGWGLTVEKVWSDENFMISHDNIYFAVYCNGEMVANTLRRMMTETTAVYDDESGDFIGYDYENSLYYYFPTLIEGASFADYTIQEVAVTDPVVDANGYVTSYGTITPLGGTEQLINGGVVAQTNQRATYSYHVTYAVGTPTGPNNNVRTDVVTNTRPGIKLVKADGAGNPLANAVFTLKDANGNDIMNAYYYSDAQGLITYAYPEQDVTYTLTEVETPDGYSALIDAITFTQSGTELTVNGGDADSVTVSQPDENGTITVTIKNFQTEFSAVKIDEETNEALPNAHFALYRQVIGSNGARKDYYPLAGYSDLVTDANGVIPGIDTTLPPNTYYLTETKAPRGYITLEHDICFTVSKDGTISMEDAADCAVLSQTLDSGNKRIYTLTISDSRTFKTVALDPQMLIADFGLDINYNVKSNNYRAANAEYSYIGICDMFSYNSFGTQTAPKQEHMLAEVDTAYKGKFGTLTLTADGNANYRIDTMAFTGEDEFCLVAHVTKIGNEAADVYVYEKLTYMPATTVYYEDDFPTGEKGYYDGVESTSTGNDFGKWTTVSSGNPAAEQAADLAKSDSANIFGFDPNYSEFATFSNNSAHKVSVGTVNNPKKGGAWPYMEFDFAGTGFDLISVTGCDTGVFTVRVYELETDTNGETVLGDSVRNVAVDTYYGYEYGKLYLGADGGATLENTGKPLYKATEELISEASPANLLTASGKFFTIKKVYYDPIGDLTETPHYYDSKGAVTATPYYVNIDDASDVRAEVPRDEESRYQPNYSYAVAEGWLLNKNATDSIYQIPVIKIRDLEYGRYRARIEPRFASFYGHSNTYEANGTSVDYFDLYVDAIRVYDPAGVSSNGTLTSAVIQEAYLYSNEAYQKFTTLKSVIVGSDALSLDASTPGMVVVDSNVPLTTERINDYAQFGPNSELYLSKGMSVAFQICATEIPADLQIMMKKISAENPTIKVTYINKDGNIFTCSEDICSATDLSYSILNLIGRDNITWRKLKSNDKFYASGLFILTNISTSDSVISVTNLKWTFKSVRGNYMIPDGNYWVAVTPKNVRSIRSVMSFMATDLALPEENKAAAVYENGTVTLTVTTGGTVDTLVIKDSNGNLIDESLLDIAFEDIDGSLRQWTVTMEDKNDDLYTFLVYAQSDGYATGDPIRVTVYDAQPEPETPTDPTQPEDPTGPTGEDPTDPTDPSGEETPKNGGEGTGSGSFLKQLREMWLRFIDLLKKILEFFNIRF